MEEWLLPSLRSTSTRVVDRTCLGKLWEEIKKLFHTQTWTKVVRSSDQNWEIQRMEKYVWISIGYQSSRWFTNLRWFSSFGSCVSRFCSWWSSKWIQVLPLQWIIEWSSHNWWGLVSIPHWWSPIGKEHVDHYLITLVFFSRPTILKFLQFQMTRPWKPSWQK